MKHDLILHWQITMWGQFSIKLDYENKIQFYIGKLKRS
jgi:hypothetical protein